MKVYIDGNDGTGKSTLVKNLRGLGIDAIDRGWLSKKSLDPRVEQDGDSLTVLLDAPVDVSLARLKRRGADMAEEYHTEESLKRFRGIYLNLAKQFGIPVVRALNQEQTLTDTLVSLWEALPEFKRGESKIVKSLGDVFLVKLIPSLYSYTNNRSAIIEDTEIERLRCHKKIVSLLKGDGIDHAHVFISPEENLVVSKYTEENPPMIETVVKAVHTGTPKHRYYNMYPTNHRYKEAYVRFDWRNPLTHPDTGARLADEVLCDELAAHFCDVGACKKTARSIWNTMSEYFKSRGIDMWDICFMLSEDGLCYSEISQDCMRAKPDDGTDVDKDCFRKGSSEEKILVNYRKFNKLIGG